MAWAEFYSPVCDPGAEYFSTILWVYKGGLNLFGVVMAAKTWNCADGVGEVRYRDTHTHTNTRNKRKNKSKFQHDR